MKKVLHCLLCLIFASALHAQKSDTSKTYVQTMDSLFSEIDKRLITTGILYDRVVPFARLDEFQPNDTSGFNHFRQAWSELNRASYAPDFAGWQTLKEKLERNLDHHVVDVGIIHARFQTVERGSDGQVKHLRMENGRFKNVSGKNPFTAKEVLLVAPLKERVWGSNITFRFTEDYWLKKSVNGLKKLEADLGNDKWQTIVNEGWLITNELSESYSHSGEQLLRFKATLSDGSELEIQSTLQVTVPSQQAVLLSDGPIKNGEVKASIAFRGYDESVAIRGKNKYRIFYHKTGGNTSQRLVKPILIIDGFDPKDERQIEFNDPGQHPDKESLYELMEYDHGGTQRNLVETLRLQGYDVVVVNHHKYTADENGKVIVGGGDYIERNAMVLIKLIQNLNVELAQNGSNEELVIIGPSMGGLISRYALTYMEKNNMPHNTRLWVSFDSPHLGANIPIAVHQMAYQFGIKGENENSKDTFLDQLQSVAARQMLIEQMERGSSQSIYNHALNNSATFRTRFFNALNSNGLPGSSGFPINLRKIALINGSLLGQRTHTPRERFIDMYAKEFFTKLVEVKLNFMGNPGESVKTFQGKVPGYDAPSMTVINKNPRGSMDVVPGATYNTGEIIYSELKTATDVKAYWFGLKFIDLAVTWNKHLDNHSFIPTASSLAFKNQDFNWNSAYKRNLVCTGEIPFDSYYGPQRNEEHITLTQSNVDWVTEEIKGNEQLPVVHINASDITGPANICNNQTTTFSFSSCEIPGPANWQASPAFQVLSKSTNSITVQANSSYRGKTFIIASFNNGITIKKEVWVGPPKQAHYSDLYVLGNKGVNPITLAGEGIYTFEIESVTGATSYSWDLPSGFSFNGGTPNGVQARIKTSPQSGTHKLKVYPKNQCGNNGTGYQYLDVRIPGGGGGNPICPNPPCQVPHPHIAISPNPTDGHVLISLEHPDSVERYFAATKENLNVIVTELSGEEIYHGTLDKSGLNINLNNSKSGVYVVRVTGKGFEFQSKLIIK